MTLTNLEGPLMGGDLNEHQLVSAETVDRNQGAAVELYGRRDERLANVFGDLLADDGFCLLLDRRTL